MRPEIRRLLLGTGMLVLFALVVGASFAYAYDERFPYPPSHAGVGTACDKCHPAGKLSCPTCHLGSGPLMGKGPHGGYSTSSRRCQSCHDVHVAAGSVLLPAATVASSCGTCHDGTGGEGVYGGIAGRGLTPAARHRIDTTTLVPGGDPSTGGTSTMTFGGPSGQLSCDDCHSPHDANTVPAFAHERRRTIDDPLSAVSTNRLLRARPGDATTTVTAYGSNWCLACHAGRVSGGALHNHPVESTATAATPFTYDSLQIMASDAMTSTTATGSLAASNRGYLMPFPRTAKQGTHKPICQQCHEDSRNVGTLSSDGTQADAATFTVTSSATTISAVTDNPRFQNFPHETVNRRMLVETDDDLCLNCHPPVALP